jgi:hypothetical protein
MKKILFALLMVMVLSTAAIAQEGFSVWSPTKTTDALIVGRPAYLLGIVITPDGTNACKVELYNNASAASGDKLIFNVAAGEAGSSGFLDQAGSFYNKGIYADLTLAAGACSYSVKYR